MSIGGVVLGVLLLAVAILGFLVRNTYMPWAWRNRFWGVWHRSDGPIPPQMWFSYYACLTFLVVLGVFMTATSIT